MHEVRSFENDGGSIGLRSSQGCTTGGPTRSREKGASLFTMIPLERWNVERRDIFLAKEKGMDDSSTSSRSPIGRLELERNSRSSDCGTQSTVGPN